jgi:FTR1 family protein
VLQAFIITLREGVEAALIVGITLAYLAKIGRNDLRKSVYAALAAAFAGSIGGAVLLSHYKLNEDIFEGWVMLVAAVFVVTMIVFMMKTGRKLKGEIEGKVGLFARGDASIGLFLFVFLMVLREGAETVLILSAVTLNSSELTSFIGTVLGIVVAILFGVMFVKGSVKINFSGSRPRFFSWWPGNWWSPGCTSFRKTACFPLPARKWPSSGQSYAMIFSFSSSSSRWPR